MQICKLSLFKLKTLLLIIAVFYYIRPGNIILCIYINFYHVSQTFLNILIDLYAYHRKGQVIYDLYNCTIHMSNWICAYRCRVDQAWINSHYRVRLIAKIFQKATLKFGSQKSTLSNLHLRDGFLFCELSGRPGFSRILFMTYGPVLGFSERQDAGKEDARYIYANRSGYVHGTSIYYTLWRRSFLLFITLQPRSFTSLLKDANTIA